MLLQRRLSITYVGSAAIGVLAGTEAIAWDASTIDGVSVAAGLITGTATAEIVITGAAGKSYYYPHNHWAPRLASRWGARSARKLLARDSRNKDIAGSPDGPYPSVSVVFHAEFASQATDLDVDSPVEP